MKANIKRARLEAAKRRGRLLKVCQMANDLAAQAEAHPAFQVAKVRTQSQRVRKHCAEVFAFAGVSGDIGDEARATVKDVDDFLMASNKYIRRPYPLSSGDELTAHVNFALWCCLDVLVRHPEYRGQGCISRLFDSFGTLERYLAGRSGPDAEDRGTDVFLRMAERL
ncbi:hypothetical protein [Bilophila wadsworthia]|jgi:hypothetical protein